LQFEDHQYYNCEITTTSGNKYRVNANWIHNESLDNWQGWQCAAGQHRLFMDESFNMYSGECLNDALGNAITGWTLFDKPTVCKQNRCTGCTDDIIQHKKEST